MANDEHNQGGGMPDDGGMARPSALAAELGRRAAWSDAIGSRSRPLVSVGFGARIFRRFDAARGTMGLAQHVLSRFGRASVQRSSFPMTLVERVERPDLADARPGRSSAPPVARKVAPATAPQASDRLDSAPATAPQASAWPTSDSTTFAKSERGSAVSGLPPLLDPVSMPGLFSRATLQRDVDDVHAGTSQPAPLWSRAAMPLQRMGISGAGLELLSGAGAAPVEPWPQAGPSADHTLLQPLRPEPAGDGAPAVAPTGAARWVARVAEAQPGAAARPTGLARSFAPLGAQPGEASLPPSTARAAEAPGEIQPGSAPRPALRQALPIARRFEAPSPTLAAVGTPSTSGDALRDAGPARVALQLPAAPRAYLPVAGVLLQRYSLPSSAGLTASGSGLAGGAGTAASFAPDPAAAAPAWVRPAAGGLGPAALNLIARSSIAPLLGEGFAYPPAASAAGHWSEGGAELPLVQRLAEPGAAEPWNQPSQREAARAAPSSDRLPGAARPAPSAPARASGPGAGAGLVPGIIARLALPPAGEPAGEPAATPARAASAVAASSDDHGAAAMPIPQRASLAPAAASRALPQDGAAPGAPFGGVAQLMRRPSAGAIVGGPPSIVSSASLAPLLQRLAEPGALSLFIRPARAAGLPDAGPGGASAGQSFDAAGPLPLVQRLAEPRPEPSSQPVWPASLGVQRATDVGAVAPFVATGVSAAQPGAGPALAPLLQRLSPAVPGLAGGVIARLALPGDGDLEAATRASATWPAGPADRHAPAGVGLPLVQRLAEPAASPIAADSSPAQPSDFRAMAPRPIHGAALRVAPSSFLMSLAQRASLASAPGQVPGLVARIVQPAALSGGAGEASRVLGPDRAGPLPLVQRQAAPPDSGVGAELDVQPGARPGQRHAAEAETVGRPAEISPLGGALQRRTPSSPIFGQPHSIPILGAALPLVQRLADPGEAGFMRGLVARVSAPGDVASTTRSHGAESRAVGHDLPLVQRQAQPDRLEGPAVQRKGEGLTPASRPVPGVAAEVASLSWSSSAGAITGAAPPPLAAPSTLSRQQEGAVAGFTPGLVARLALDAAPPLSGAAAGRALTPAAAGLAPIPRQASELPLLQRLVEPRAASEDSWPLPQRVSLPATHQAPSAAAAALSSGAIVGMQPARLGSAPALPLLQRMAAPASSGLASGVIARLAEPGATVLGNDVGPLPLVQRQPDSSVPPAAPGAPAWPARPGGAQPDVGQIDMPLVESSLGPLQRSAEAGGVGAEQGGRPGRMPSLSSAAIVGGAPPVLGSVAQALSLLQRMAATGGDFSVAQPSSRPSSTSYPAGSAPDELPLVQRSADAPALPAMPGMAGLASAALAGAIGRRAFSHEPPAGASASALGQPALQHQHDAATGGLPLLAVQRHYDGVGGVSERLTSGAAPLRALHRQHDAATGGLPLLAVQRQQLNPGWTGVAAQQLAGSIERRTLLAPMPEALPQQQPAPSLIQLARVESPELLQPVRTPILEEQGLPLGGGPSPLDGGLLARLPAQRAFESAMARPLEIVAGRPQVLDLVQPARETASAGQVTTSAVQRAEGDALSLPAEPEIAEATKPDIEALARQVYARLRRRLIVDAERRGRY